jgi:hypothetical protein
VRKALEIVKKFEMNWPSLEQKKPMKFFGNGEMEKGASPKKMNNQDDDDNYRDKNPRHRGV